jgi:hypothetical protein
MKTSAGYSMYGRHQVFLSSISIPFKKGLASFDNVLVFKLTLNEHTRSFRNLSTWSLKWYWQLFYLSVSYLKYSACRNTIEQGKAKLFAISFFLQVFILFDEFHITEGLGQIGVFGVVSLPKKHFSRGNVLPLAVPNIVQITCNYLTDQTRMDFVIA